MAITLLEKSTYLIILLWINWRLRSNKLEKATNLSARLQHGLRMKQVENYRQPDFIRSHGHPKNLRHVERSGDAVLLLNKDDYKILKIKKDKAESNTESQSESYSEPSKRKNHRMSILV